jgi:hypothetical protein
MKRFVAGADRAQSTLLPVWRVNQDESVLILIVAAHAGKPR